ncbi:MAG: hypothetical protein AB1847_03360 [bacterium]
MGGKQKPGWSVFKQIFADHWEEFKRLYPLYDTPYYDNLVERMLACGTPEKMGYIEYRLCIAGRGQE